MLSSNELPIAGDPSSLGWWKEREESARRARTARPETQPSSSSSRERLRALFVLGLDEEATEDDVRAAYRRLSQVHHPDKFQAIGPDAVRAATETFKRIQAAFELLTRK